MNRHYKRIVFLVFLSFLPIDVAAQQLKTIAEIVDHAATIMLKLSQQSEFDGFEHWSIGGKGIDPLSDCKVLELSNYTSGQLVYYLHELLGWNHYWSYSPNVRFFPLGNTERYTKEGRYIPCGIELSAASKVNTAVLQYTFLCNAYTGVITSLLQRSYEEQIKDSKAWNAWFALKQIINSLGFVE